MDSVEQQLSLISAKGDTESDAAILEATDAALIEIEQDPTNTPQQRARVCYLRGLRATKQHNLAEAEAHLSKAVKLDPPNIRAWNALGNCLAGKGDFVGARDCFLGSNSQQPNSEAFRCLSMTLRKIGTTAEEKANHTMESMEMAKKAVGLDVTDGESWYVLGNAYLAIFFALSHNFSNLKNALKAYKRADALMSAKPNAKERNPDLFFNRGQVHYYLEQYEQAIADYKIASSIDVELPANDRIEEIEHKIQRSAEMVLKKGKIKPKRIKAALETFRAPPALQKDEANPTKDIENLQYVGLSGLVMGENQGKAMELKMLMPLSKQDPPLSFLVMDQSSNTFVLSVYHLDHTAQDKIKPEKDQFTVLHPNLRQISYKKGEASHEYPLVQVHSPVHFFVNGKLLKDSFAHAAMATESVA